MTCIGTAYGASPLTFLGLAGVGDLFLTCSSSNSRNYTVGYRLGKGEKLDVIMSTLGSVAEGVPTTKGVKKIIEEMEINAPIANAVRLHGSTLCCVLIMRQVYEVLFNGKEESVGLKSNALTTHRQRDTNSGEGADGAATVERAGAAAEGGWAVATPAGEAGG